MSTRVESIASHLAPAIIGALAAMLALTNVARAQPPTNGTRWPTYSVCYRVDPSAAGFGLQIDQAASSWTNASTGGFKFIKDTTGSCANIFYEGFIDGLKLWYGYTIIYTNSGPAGCFPEIHQCPDPSPGSPILSAYSVLESRQCSENQQNCICRTQSPLENDFHDPLGCGLVLLPPGYCGAGPIPNTVMTTTGLRWDTPGVYETALHEFGHWLWMGDTFIVNPQDRDSAMDWLAPQACTLPGLAPDYYTLFGVDIFEFNQLYP